MTTQQHEATRYQEAAARYRIVLVRTPDNWGAYAPAVLGCVSTGATPEETATNMRAALAFHLRGMEEDGEAWPDPLVEYDLEEDQCDDEAQQL